MDVRLNDFPRRWELLGGEIVAALERVGAGGRYVLGERVDAFERDLAAAWGVGHAVGVGSGLDALEIALRCLGIGPGKRVLTTPLSAFASTLAICRVGAIPVFVDVDAVGLVDLARCRDAVRRDDGLRGLLPVHLYGHPVDLDALERLREDFDLTIVEDCAQSVGATWRGRATGTVGPIAATSFYPTKNLGALGDGGAVLTSSDEHAACARALRHYGQRETYAHDRLGLNSRLDEIQAAVLGGVFLPRLVEWTAERRRTAERYCREIGNEAIGLPRLPPEASSSWHLFPVVVDADRREDFVRHLRRCGIECATHYPRLIPEQAALRQYGRFEVIGELSNARRFAAGEVSLPVHPHLQDDEVARVVAACNEWRGV